MVSEEAHMSRYAGTSVAAYAVSAMSMICAVGLWYAASHAMNRPDLLPHPEAIPAVFLEMVRSGELGSALHDSLIRVFVGYFGGTLLGIVTGVLLGRLPALNKTIGLLFDFMKGIPPIAIVPLVIIWFGIGELSKYIVVGYIVWVVVAINTSVGVREIPLVRLRAGEIFGLHPVFNFLQIVIPSTVPYIIAGTRSAIGFAFVALVSAELIAANTGLGQIIMDARFSLQTDKMIVGLLLLGALGSVIQIGFDMLVKWLDLSRRYQS